MPTQVFRARITRRWKEVPLSSLAARLLKYCAVSATSMLAPSFTWIWVPCRSVMLIASFGAFSTCTSRYSVARPSW